MIKDFKTISTFNRIYIKFPVTSSIVYACGDCETARFGKRNGIQSVPVVVPELSGVELKYFAATRHHDLVRNISFYAIIVPGCGWKSIL
jgi:hypothetical protein